MRLFQLAQQPPGVSMVTESDVRVILLGCRGGQQDDDGGPAGFVGQPDQLPADSVALMGFSHGEVGEICGVTEISERARDTDQQFAVPSRYDQIRIQDHLPHAVAVVHRTARPQAAGTVQIDDGVKIQIVSGSVGDHGAEMA
jgi:hypothetical protein